MNRLVHRHKVSQLRRAGVLLAVLLAPPPIAKAQGGAQPGAQPGARVRAEFRIAARRLLTARVDRTRMTPTRGAVRPSARTAVDLGAVDAATPMEHMQLVLRRTAERQAAFDAEIAALHRPGDPSYHQWLTPQE
ncbi:MAG TPA: hypothetical protein VN678_10305, partial [Acidobacteriaceae bacterium]|nr:hypothetical protein [Acidobacteriaceae bacterium]